ncbi:MAG: TonB-dependent receptor [Alphaproteobacteria bacterium]
MAARFGTLPCRQPTTGPTASARKRAIELADADGLEATSVHGKTHVELSPWLHFEGVAHYARSDAEFDGASAFPPFAPADPARLLKTRDIAARAELQAKPASWLDTALSYAFAKSGRDDFSNGAPFAFGSTFDGTRHRTSLITTAKLTSGQSLLVGADAERLEAGTDSWRGRTSGYGFYGEWQAGFGEALYTTAGLRFDHGGKFGDHLSGRATGAWLFRLAEGNLSKLHASYGTGFREPSLFEQATNLGAALPALREETSKAFDIGLNQTLWNGALDLDVTYFDQTIENEIRFDNVGFTGYFQSAGKSQSRGVEGFGVIERELGGNWFSSWRLQSAYTYTDAKVHSPDPEDGLPRVRRPRHMSASALTLAFWRDRADLTVSLRTAAKAEDGFREFRVPLDDYAVFGITSRWRVTPHVEIYATGVNIANEQYEEISGFATSDAALYVGMRIRS